MRRNQKTKFFNNFFVFNKKREVSDEYIGSGQNISSDTGTVVFKKEVVSETELYSMFNSLKYNIIERYKHLNNTTSVYSSFSSLVDDFEQIFLKLQTNDVISDKHINYSKSEKIKSIQEKTTASTQKTKSKDVGAKAGKSCKSSEVIFEVKPNNLSGINFIDKNIKDYQFDFVKISGEKENASLVYRKEWEGECLSLEYTNNEYILKSFYNIVEISKDKDKLLRNFYKNLKTMNTFDKVENISGRTQTVKCYDRRAIKFNDIYTWFSFYEGSPISTCCSCGVSSETYDFDGHDNELCCYCGNVKY
jgi:hypothetical protein